MSHSTKRLDLTGQRFGKLTVTEAAPAKGGHTAWRCRCDCGNQRIVRTDYLRIGKVSACEVCAKAPEQRLDLAGQRFGSLTVLEPGPKQGRRTTWRCRCDCGNKRTIVTRYLRSGEITSCTACVANARRVDLTGQRFGKLTALEPGPRKGNDTTWWCKCDCGNRTLVRTAHLRSGQTTSCGCLGNNLDGLHYIDGTCVEMLRSNPLRRNNTSGVTGVEWVERDKRWRATICFKGKRTYLGVFRDFGDAVAARKKAESEQHGAFLADYDAGKYDTLEPQNAVAAL